VRYKGKISGMENAHRVILAIIAGLLFLPLFALFGADANDVGTGGRSVKAAVIICDGMIDDGLFQSIKRRTKAALEEGADYVIYEIDTYGGLVTSADDISNYFILEVGKEAHTVAYVTKKAISAGAMISVSCQDIIMRRNTTLGDCAPITMGGKLEGVEREKAESFIRAIFAKAAEANNYPKALLKAMVSQQLEVFRVQNRESGAYEFFESEQLPKDANRYDLANKELIVKDDEILTLTASDAVKYGVARAQVEDLRGVLEFLERRDGVRFSGEPLVFEPNWSEQMVRWLNSPAVMGILVMVALLGLYIELNSPGIGLPGLVAAICFAIIIGSKYLVGLANWVEVALFVVGVLLLLVEIFLIPGFGITGALGIICILAGLFGMLLKNSPGEIPWPRNEFDWQMFTNGALGLAVGFLAFVVAAWLFSRYMPKLEFLSGLILVPSKARQGNAMKVGMTVPPESEAAGIKVGDLGEVVTKLRPIGRAKFGEAIVDVVAEAEFLDKGVNVEIIEIHGNKVVVRAVGEQESEA